jgi:hypothetical protein
MTEFRHSDPEALGLIRTLILNHYSISNHQLVTPTRAAILPSRATHEVETLPTVYSH